LLQSLTACAAVLPSLASRALQVAVRILLTCRPDLDRPVWPHDCSLTRLNDLLLTFGANHNFAKLAVVGRGRDLRARIVAEGPNSAPMPMDAVGVFTWALPL